MPDGVGHFTQVVWDDTTHVGMAFVGDDLNGTSLSVCLSVSQCLPVSLSLSQSLLVFLSFVYYIQISVLCIRVHFSNLSRRTHIYMYTNNRVLSSLIPSLFLFLFRYICRCELRPRRELARTD
jgi:hypothetical protein